MIRPSRRCSPTVEVVAVLNDRWRVLDDKLQWLLQVRKGRPTAKSSGCRNRFFCTQRPALLRCIREHCGDVDPDALSVIEALPDRHGHPILQRGRRSKEKPASNRFSVGAKHRILHRRNNPE